MKQFFSTSALCLVTLTAVGNCCFSDHELSQLTPSETDLVTKKRTSIEQEIGDLDHFLQQEAASQVTDEIGIVRYTITLYKDRTNKKSMLWNNIISKTAHMGDRSRAHDVTEDELQTIITLIADAVLDAADHGIAADVNIEMSDGAPAQKCCGEQCMCATRYNGNCPCSLNAQRGTRCWPWSDADMDDTTEESMKDTDDMSLTSDDTIEDLNDIDLNSIEETE